MPVLEVLRWPDARLRTPCASVSEITPEVRRLASDMLETMYAAPGRGLAAPQVGALVRMFVMDVTWKEGDPDPQVMINPQILERSGDLAEGPEGCLSIPGVTAMVPRARHIRLAWTGLDGAPVVADLSGMAAICAQHEYDHLDGLVTFDRLSPEARTLAEAEFAASETET